MPIPSFENEKNVDEIAMIDIQKYKIKQIKYFQLWRVKGPQFWRKGFGQSSLKQKPKIKNRSSTTCQLDRQQKPYGAGFFSFSSYRDLFRTSQETPN